MTGTGGYALKILAAVLTKSILLPNIWLLPIHTLPVKFGVMCVSDVFFIKGMWLLSYRDCDVHLGYADPL